MALSAPLSGFIKLHGHPQISPLVHELNTLCQNTRKTHEEIFHSVISLAESLSRITDLKPLTCSRINFIGQTLFDAAKERKFENILIKTALLKSSLQVEALIYGGIDPLIRKYKKVQALPNLGILHEKIPEMMGTICFSSAIEDGYKINIAPLRDYLEKDGLDAIPEQFHIHLLELINNYQLEKDVLIIPFGKLPAKEKLVELIGSESIDPYSKLLAQTLMVYLEIENQSLKTGSCIDHELLFLQFATNIECICSSERFRQTFLNLEQDLRHLQKMPAMKGRPKPSGRMLSAFEASCRQLKKRSPLYPLNHAITPYLMLLKDHLKGRIPSKASIKPPKRFPMDEIPPIALISCPSLLQLKELLENPEGFIPLDTTDEAIRNSSVFKGDFLEIMSHSFDHDWLEDSAGVFDLILKIESGLKSRFLKQTPDGSKEIDSVCKDNISVVLIDSLVRFMASKGFDSDYPINQENPLCKDKVSFLKLPFPRYIQACMVHLGLDAERMKETLVESLEQR